MPSFILATGTTLHLVGVCANRTGVEGRMALVVSRRAKRRCRLIALALATALAAPSLAQARDNSIAPAPRAATEAAPTAPAAATDSGAKPFHPRRARKAARSDLALPRRPAGAALGRERLSGADRPGTALARQEQGRGRQQRLFLDRQPGLGSGGEGAGALSQRDHENERRSRMDDGPRRRRSEPAPGRRRRHSGAARRGGKGGGPEDDAAAGGLEHLCRRSFIHHNRTRRAFHRLCPVL